MTFCDEFIILNIVQYTKEDWRTRNRIRTREGWSWLTVQVQKRAIKPKLNETEICYRSNWMRKHLSALQMNYQPYQYFESIYDFTMQVLTGKLARLTNATILLIRILAELLGIKALIMVASELPIQIEERQLRILGLCKFRNANVYYSGLAARDYINIALFQAEAVSVGFQNYKHSVYKQHFLGFESHMSIVDLLMNHGPDAREVLLSSPRLNFASS